MRPVCIVILLLCLPSLQGYTQQIARQIVVPGDRSGGSNLPVVTTPSLVSQPAGKYPGKYASQLTVHPVMADSAPASPLGNVPEGYEFSFARLVYHSNGWSDWPRWQADWPEAEWHFSSGLQRLTRIETHPEGVLVRLDGDDIFDYPWIYAVEVGSLSLSPSESARLREYLLRGGFLVVDDFHGRDQWQYFESAMRQVFPEYAIEELDSGTESFEVLFEIGTREQIPGIRPLMANRTWEYGGTIPRWRVIRDDSGRVMVAINFNMDLGDAWEHADDSRYPQRYSSLAYRIGTNYVLYAMTH